MRNKQLSLILFLFIELYIYISLICFNDYINNKLMFFSSILICFIISLFMFCKTKDYLIMFIAILLSLIGDIFFIFFKNIDYIGLIFINIVQILYFLRIYLSSDYKKANILSRIIFLPIIVIVTFMVLKENTNIEAILWSTFMMNLFINILFTIKEIGLNNLFPIGLLFLLLYGTSIMLVSIENYISVNIGFINIITSLPFNIVHVFYLPAQVLLTCSIFTVNRRYFSKIKQDEDQ